MWTPTTPKRTLLAAALMSTMLLAGCVGGDESTDPANAAPEAVLDVDQDSAMTQEEFTFDAQDSRDDGEIATWRFDFGDGQSMEVDDVDDARVKHAYAQGGEYTVTLTVTDDGGDQSGARTDTTQVRVAVNEAYPVAESALHSSPLANQTSTATFDFEGQTGIDQIVFDGEATSLLVAGSSELRVALIGPDGTAVIEDSVVLDAGETVEIDLDAPVADAGDYQLVFEAESGSVTVGGELSVFYDDGF